MVNIEIGQNTRELIERVFAYLTEVPTFSTWDTIFGTTIGLALINDYQSRGGRSPAVILGLTYTGLMLKNSRLGFISVAIFGSLFYWNMVRKDTKK